MSSALLSIILLFSFMPSEETLTLTHDGETLITIHRTEFADGILGRAAVDEDKYAELEDTIATQVYMDPVNAKLDEFGQIIPEETGITLDRRAFRELFFEYFYGSERVSTDVPTFTLFAKVDKELLKEIRAVQMGAYVTYFNSHNKERAHNITLAAEAINNYVVFPNERFSFNKAVGKRTPERGYLPAPVIVRGELTEGIGGGICQVSSTLFNAVDKAGMNIIERYTHSKRVTYVPPGRDATVSWYGPDFAFTNRHNQPILILAKTYHGTLLVKFFSSEEIDYTPRDVPRAPNKLPPEVDVDE
ncbi:VanW family protein [Alkalihalophilus marmarensis]|uniref:VanW family protein n=1 Tax=Alkalihalophilus marmarensis TaxID=521377 RepID=UPI00204209DE|nr:VanW family protein [Alkalihalophilus marmarensis]MCM3490109.1 VanW family protein [Alkalihalophilus marmarensis]